MAYEPYPGVILRQSLTFDLADDLLSVAADGGVSVLEGTCQTERLGPLLELHVGMRALPDRYKIGFKSDDWIVVQRCLAGGGSVGNEFGSRWGVFAFSSLGSPEQDVWVQWLARFEKAAGQSGFGKQVAKGLAGAFHEIAENVNEHSQAWKSGCAAFRTSSGKLEFVVSDSGIGVLGALRTCSTTAGVRDDADALLAAVTRGWSSRPGGKGGHGINDLFRALAELNGEVRFRSGNQALTLRGRALGRSSPYELCQRASLPGLTVSVLCLV